MAVGSFAACVEEDFDFATQDEVEVGVFGDEMKVNLNFVAPDPVAVSTRAVDPDGRTLQDLYLFCFDENGLFLTTSKADINGDSEDNLSGTFTATIPKTTRIIHFLANQNMSVFDKNEYVYRTEDDVLSALEGSAGMLIYWARVEAPLNINEYYTDAQYENGHSRTVAEAFIDWLTIETNPASKKHRGISGKGHPIIMLRNQAKFTVVSDGDDADLWKGDYFEVTGFAICNSYAFGTVAPYHTDYGFPTYSCETFKPEFGVVEDQSNGIKGWLTERNVTLAARKDKMSEVTDVDNARETYIFESNNPGTDPIDMIIRGYNVVNGVREQDRLYYRVNILDENGDYAKILRNHHYEVHIGGNLNNGVQTFADALAASPTNNIWLSISDEVTSVRDNSYVLSVEKTGVIVEVSNTTNEPENRLLHLNFNVSSLDPVNKPVDMDKLSIVWMDEEQRVSNTYNPSLTVGNAVTYDAATGDGVITLNLNNLATGVEYERGVIVVKYGRLQRKISVVLMRTQYMIPTWVSAEVYGNVTGDKASRANVTVVFTVPETCPEEYFPMDVLVTTNNLDGRAATGQVLPVVRTGDEDYGKTFSVTTADGTVVTDIGYKYKFTVQQPGQYRLYFENILPMANKAYEYVTLEAKCFDLVTKAVTYVDHQNEIKLHNLSSYAINAGADEEEMVYYLLVPQKRFYPVVFNIGLQESNDSPLVYPLEDEEFLLYSSHLDHYLDDETRLAIDEADKNANSSKYYVTTDFYRNDFDCVFKPYSSSLWSSGGRIFGFYPRADKTNFWENDMFQIYMETNKPASAEVVRIASNQIGSPQVKDASKVYEGATYRSVTFELANYRPFRFAAQVNGEGSYRLDDGVATPLDEVVDNIQFEYYPEQVIAVSFDLTGFTANDNTVVDPFGTGFEVYIDAPMLELASGLNKSVQGVDLSSIQVQMFDKDENDNGYFENKPKLEDLGNGRFVYRVDAYAADEAAYWTDSSTLNQPLILRSGAQSYGERKTIYFKKKSIVSNGVITVSANPDHVTYHSKSFKVSSTPILGMIGYKVADGDIRKVPAGQFVTFTRKFDGTRIGSLTVKSRDENLPDARTYYELLLRAEYEFYWENDPIEVMCSIDGVYYSAEISSLKDLWENMDKSIVLE